MSGVWVEKSVLMTDEECAIEAIEAIGGRVLHQHRHPSLSDWWSEFHVEQTTWPLHTSLQPSEQQQHSMDGTTQRSV